jgi:hypothetical protein
MARLAAESTDLPAAHGIRLALNSSVPTGAMHETDIGAVHEALDLIVYPDAEAARAEYLATKIEYDELAGAGPMNDPAVALFANPIAAINRTRAAAAIEGEDGALRHLSDGERIRLQRLAGTIKEAEATIAA